MSLCASSRISKRLKYPLTFILLLCLSGCAKPVPIAFNQVCQKENDNRYISVEGYLRTGVTVHCSSRNGTSACGIELVEKPDGESKISVYVEEGTGNSQMEPLPKSYSDENLKLRTKDGQSVGAKDRVRIIGTAKTATDAINSSYTVCYIDVSKIEKP
ncbi:MAG: hypothetical protein JOZ52_06825 [Acidobacteria bacterium]|nr:hypothetical protein [Acidobacteriota bacterium]